MKKTVIIGVCGGIAAYKIPELISRLRKKGINIEVIMTRAATEFVTPLTFREISQNPVHHEMFPESMQWNVQHIALAKKADLFVVVPATANIIGKIANGIADDLLTTTIMAAACPKLIAPAMNSGMYQNDFFQRNLKELIKAGYTVVGPESGALLCGDEGVGRLAELTRIELQIQRLLTAPDLAGEEIVVTAGGTREFIDPVRYIGNRSSGLMGHALAEAAFCRGARVTLITAAEKSPLLEGVQIIRVETTAAMREAVLKAAESASMIIKAAAPADFRPTVTQAGKIKKSNHGMNIELAMNPDILAELGARKPGGQFLVGFAAETESLRDYALEKMKRKNLDLIIGNLVDQSGRGIGAPTNQVTIYSRNGELELAELPKRALADDIFDVILYYRKNHGLPPRQ